MEVTVGDHAQLGVVRVLLGVVGGVGVVVTAVAIEIAECLASAPR